MTKAPRKWLPVPGYPDYEVSDRGDVRRDGRILSLNVREGRARLSLSQDDRQASLHVSRLVCEAFHGPAPSTKHKAAHIDGDTGNNAAANLRWRTPKQIADDKTARGTVATGKRGAYVRLSADRVRDLRAVHAAGLSLRATAKAYGIGLRQLVRIVKHQTRPEVAGAAP